jgi:hypothetical protein
MSQSHSLVFFPKVSRVFFYFLYLYCGLGVLSSLGILIPSLALAQSSKFLVEDKKISRSPLFYEVSAEAKAVNTDFVTARKKAVKSAMKIAVGNAIESILGEETDHSNKKIIRNIISRSEKYVKGYRFLSSFDNLSLMLAEVRLEVEVYSRELKKNLRSLGVLQTPADDRAVVILIMETGISFKQISFWDSTPMSETALIRDFQAAGIQTISRNSIRDLISEGSAQSAAEGDIASAVEVGYRVGADVVIIGKAISSTAQRGEDGIQASVNLKAISSSRGSLIAARSEFATALEQDSIRGELSAFEKATSKISKFFISSVQQFWAPKTRSSLVVNKMGSSGGKSTENSTEQSVRPASSSGVPSIFGDL